MLAVTFVLTSGTSTGAQDDSTTKPVEINRLGIALCDHRPIYKYYPQNIYYQMCKKLDTLCVNGNFNYNVSATEQKLRDLIGDKSVVCKLTVQPSGDITSLTVEESSGSKIIDEKAIKFIKDAGPYCVGNWSGHDKTFHIELPKLFVKEKE
jgi:TonB family protein